MGIVTCDIAVSADGFAAGPNQRREVPLGDRGEELHRWMFEAADENRAEIDGILSHGAYIMGRNMFGPPRDGGWDEPWQGWWGAEPPYDAPVFVLTHTPRSPIPMAGGTTFHFDRSGAGASARSRWLGDHRRRGRREHRRPVPGFGHDRRAATAPRAHRPGCGRAAVRDVARSTCTRWRRAPRRSRRT